MELFPPNSLFLIRRTRQKVVSDIEQLANGNTIFNIQMVSIFDVHGRGEIVRRLDDNKASHDVDRLSNGNTIYVGSMQRERLPSARFDCGATDF